MNSSSTQSASTSSGRGAPDDRRVREVRHLRDRVVAPDRHPPDVGVPGAGLGRELADRPVVVEPRHGRELRRGEVGRVAHGDQRVRVGRVADHQHLDVAGGVGVERLALDGEDGAVRLQEVLALHAGPTRARPDQQRVLRAVEGHVRVVGGDDPVQEGEGAVVQLHDHALERLQRGGDLQEPQDHGLVATEEVAGGDAEQEGVADLAGGAGDRDVHGCVHGVASVRAAWGLRQRRPSGRHPTRALARGHAPSGPRWRSMPPSRRPGRGAAGPGPPRPGRRAFSLGSRAPRGAAGAPPGRGSAVRWRRGGRRECGRGRRAGA